jgi:hypothetical protein
MEVLKEVSILIPQRLLVYIKEDHINNLGGI